MAVKSTIKFGQLVRRLQAGEIAPVYALYGGDPFLEDYFISELKKVLIQDGGEIKHYSMDQDREDDFFRELSAFSLFEDKRIIVVRELKKLKSKNSREELINYIQSPNPNTCLILISEEYDLRNSFLKNIADKSQLADVRPPFKSDMTKWVSYILKQQEITITPSALEQYMELYGDSIANVINEIEKTALFLGKDTQITEDSFSKYETIHRTFQIWHFQDSLGKKDLQKSLTISTSLLENGTAIQQLVVSLSNLFQQLLWQKMGQTKPTGYTGLNKIITSNLNNYNRSYGQDELENLLHDLRKTDVLSKSTSLKPAALLQPILAKICKGLYV